MPLASLTDLPNELLVDIFGKPTFPTESLYSLAVLCRRLHLIALPIYFSRHGIDLEKKSATITLERNRLGPLPGLQICTFAPAMEHVSCTFPRQSCAAIRPFVSQIKHLHAFFFRLSSIGTVTLDLDPFMHPHAWGSLVGTSEELQEWARVYGALLSCIVQRGCSSLTVINGGHLVDTHQVQSRGYSMRRLVPSVIRRLWSPKQPRVLRRSGIRLLPLKSSDHASRLTSLHLQSATLLTHSGLDWTLSVLRQSPITSLTISMSCIFEHLDKRAWERFLPRIASAAANLTALSLLHVPFWVVKLALSFVAQLPQLIHLTLDFPLDLTPVYPIWRHTWSLKQVVTLRAPPVVVDRLLARAGALPLIQTVALVWNATTDSNIIRLTAPLLSIARTLRKRGLSPRIFLSLPIARMTFVSEHALPEAFLCVHEIHLTANGAPLWHFEEDLCEGIARFVALSPSVTYVGITTDGDVPPEYVSSLVEGVRATGWFHVIEVNGARYDLSRPS
ncbi:hypothetical protein C8R45DRAFT_559918 [Mycena sanguinolenta]|nr:hypothetical protein C8R45DRAFT_559918 [Mycena sanguinolenta]